MQQQEIKDFQAIVWRYYKHYGRHDMPWRRPEKDGSFNPYKIMLSEVMLQQTQVTRVIPKHQQFLTRFPDLASLANAEVGEVLRAWSGLGYNRRAKFLHQAARILVNDYHSAFPMSQAELVKLPGIGPNTAGAILAYTYNQPVVFIETNIRTVFIHHFFNDQSGVTDKQIYEAVARTLSINKSSARTWYWALMDYGVFLKSTIGNLNKLSKSYTKQSAFHGSRRQIRGAVLRLLHKKPLPFHDLEKQISDDRLIDVINTLLAEGLIQKSNDTYSL